MAAIAQIVDGHNGALVLDLNVLSGQGGRLRQGLDLTEGQLAGFGDTAVWSPLTGPAGLARRRITVPFLLVGSSADDLGARVTTLMRATQAPWWLRIRRHGATSDSWLQCFPCVPQVDSQVTGGSHAHQQAGTITAETAPYALGARVDGPSTAVGQNPTGNAWGLNIDNVPGDTATPLLLRIKDPSAFGQAFGAFISVRRRQTPANLAGTALVRQAESGLNTHVSGANLTLANGSGDSDMSGGSYVRATFGSGYTALTSGSITFAAPTLSGPDVPGVYRLFVRVRRNGTANTQQLVLKPFLNGSLITPEDITIPANGAATRVVDLGLVQWPAGQPAALQAPLSPSGATPTRVTLQFWRKSPGAATVDFDYMCWIPADEDGGFLTTEGPLQAPSSDVIVVDGYQHLATTTDADPLGAHSIKGQSYGSVVPTVSWTGGAPRVRPGTNRLFVTLGVGGITSWPVALNLTVAYSYWPRFTWLR